MKYSTLAVATAIILTTFGASEVLAQDGRRGHRVSGEDRIERTVDRLDKKLDLSDAQEARLKELFSEEAAEVKGWHEANEDASREERQEFMQSRGEARRASLEQILTAEQIAQLDDLGPMRHRAKRGDGRRDGRGGGQHGFGVDLDLSDEQKTQLKEVRETMKADAKVWRESNPDATRDEQREFMEARRDANRAALESILTAEQLAQIEERGALHQRPRGDGRRGGQRRFGADLDLSDEQKAQLKEVREVMKADAKVWRESNPDATREQRHEFRTEQRASLQQAMEGILTAEQLEKLNSHRAARPDRGEKPTRPDVRSEQGEQGESVLGLSNHPNPFNPTTSIQFTLPQAGHTSLVVYDLQGRAVATLVDGQMDAGPHTATFDAEGLPTGTYLYRLTIGTVSETGRMVLLK